MRSIIVFLSLLIITSLLEVIVRVWVPGIGDDQKIRERSAINIYSLKPSYKGKVQSVHGEFAVTVKTNALGLRDNQEFALVKPDRTFRILMLGDSFTFGYGVEGEEAYPKQLEKLFKNYIKGVNIEVLNAGFADGWAPDTEYLYLKKRGIHFNPDLVILGFFEGNDLIDLSKNIWVEQENQLPLRIIQPGIKFVPQIIKERSALYQFLKWRSRVLLKKVFNVKHGLYSPSQENPVKFQNLIHKHLKSLKFLIKGMRDVSQENNSLFAVIVIPSIKAFSGNEGDLELTRIRNDIIDFAIKENIKILNLVPAFLEQKNDKKKPLYFEMNEHWTMKGHLLAAQHIFKFLISEKLIPKAL